MTEILLAVFVVLEGGALIYVSRRNAKISDDRFRIAQRKAELTAALSFYRDAWDSRGVMGERGHVIKKARPSAELIRDAGQLASETLSHPLYPENGSRDTDYEKEWIGVGVVPESDEE